MWIFETELVGCFRDTVAFHQEILALVDNETVDVAYGCAACGFVNHVSEVPG